MRSGFRPPVLLGSGESSNCCPEEKFLGIKKGTRAQAKKAATPQSATDCSQELVDELKALKGNPVKEGQECEMVKEFDTEDAVRRSPRLTKRREP